MNQVTVVILDVVQKSKEIVISFFGFFFLTFIILRCFPRFCLGVALLIQVIVHGESENERFRAHIVGNSARVYKTEKDRRLAGSQRPNLTVISTQCYVRIDRTPKVAQTRFMKIRRID